MMPENPSDQTNVGLIVLTLSPIWGWFFEVAPSVCFSYVRGVAKVILNPLSAFHLQSRCTDLI